MSLFQEITDFPKQLNKKYHRNDMSEILEEYCQHFANNATKDELLERVMPVDKERYLASETILNSGHVFSGIMWDQNCYEKFENWFNQNKKGLNTY